jgi:hypothetical protein
VIWPPPNRPAICPKNERRVLVRLSRIFFERLNTCRLSPVGSWSDIILEVGRNAKNDRPADVLGVPLYRCFFFPGSISGSGRGGQGWRAGRRAGRRGASSGAGRQRSRARYSVFCPGFRAWGNLLVPVLTESRSRTGVRPGTCSVSTCLLYHEMNVLSGCVATKHWLTCSERSANCASSDVENCGLRIGCRAVCKKRGIVIRLFPSLFYSGL